MRRSSLRVSLVLALSLGAGTFLGCAHSTETAEGDKLTQNVGNYPPGPTGVEKPRVAVPPFEVKTAGGSFGSGSKGSMNDVAADQTLRHVLVETEHLQDLTDQLLAVSRARSAPVEPGASTDPAAAVGEVLAGYRTPDADRVHVVDGRTAGRPASIPPADLHRVLRNLLDNALRHAATAVRIDVGDDEPGLVVLTVANDGAPIPDDERERIFEPFVRLDEARSRDDGGTGLGLTIVRGLVERAGGSVSARSRDGETAFVVRLPADAPTA